ncbi:hypothetical protein DEU34_2868 [Microbacterium sp. AG1240]|uniref:hypothetical protein n=1 Tax=Microbacterium sp. AG1240 TaxID=2183992 RepID=UPI000F24CB6D|nr:hypothetical protein [Microbacterium sp. AG1240]RKT31792.1 hypothetical protein DEU34_2868 [Microbacterium sp. AG1240]
MAPWMDDRLRPEATARERAAAALLWMPGAAVIATALTFGERLPAVLPTVWRDDTVVATAPTPAVLAVTGGIALAVGIIGLIALLPEAARIRRAVFLLGGVAGGIAAGIWIVTVALVLTSGFDLPHAGGWPLLGVLAGLFGLVPFSVSPRRRRDEHYEPVQLTLADGETGAWVRTVPVPGFAWATAIFGAIAAAVLIYVVLSGEFGAAVGLIALGVATFASAAFARLRISVDRRGLRVVSALIGAPLARIRLDSIRSAEPATIRPAEWGGWGYRFLPGRSAIVIARGPGIVVHRRDGRRFAVNAPHPETPAALLSALVERQEA